MSICFSHLHTHSAPGSMGDSLVRIDDLFKKAKELGQNSIAITDHGTMAALLDARKAAKKYGVKYIPGLEAYFVDDVNSEEKQKRAHIVLLAKNKLGYENLLKINYEGFSHFKYIPVLNKVFPQVDWAIIEKYKEGVICLTACGSGVLAREMFRKDAQEEWNQETADVAVINAAARLKEIFGDNLYLEVQTHSLKKYKTNKKTHEIEKDGNGDPIVVVDQEYINRRLMALSQEMGIKVVGTSDVHYIEKADAKIHDMLMAINDKKPLSDKNRHRYEVEDFYLKSGKEVFDHFAKLFGDQSAKQICDTSCEIANLCDDSVYLDNTEIRFPRFNVAETKDYAAFSVWLAQQKNKEVALDNAYLRYRCAVGFAQKFKTLPEEKKKEYKERIVTEIKVFEALNFSSYMLVVADLIDAAREQSIRVGPGRGSCGGSLVAHILGIHEVDPIQYGLIFERFLNKEKKAFPDIDTDFAPSGRDSVEKYAIAKYGKEKVAHVSNLSCMTPKVVIKDLARSLELGGNKSEAFKIANAITDSISIHAKSFDDALKESDDFKAFCAKYPSIETYGRKLVGLEKTYATHAAGIIISDVDLSCFAPLRYDKNNNVAVQYEKNKCEAVGLIKMDLLGLEHLDIIDETIKNARSLGENCKETSDLAPFDDAKVWDMICAGKTTCVFQMGSSHMKNLCKQIKPRNIEDLSLVNALGRPSAVKSRESYIARRNGEQKVTYLHDSVRPALQETLGVCVYEEQLIKLAKYVAGWDLNKADGLRKLTKMKEKGKELAAKLKEDFINDAVVFNKMPKALAHEIWETIVEPFEGYGFNKAHGIFYSLNGYHTAYYKYHYPAAFMAAVLKSEVSKPSSNAEKLAAYKQEAIRMGIKIIAPSINKSEEFFSVFDSKTVVMGLAAIKGVGTKAVTDILSARKNCEFKSFADFLYRTSSNVVRSNVIQALAKGGCFDCLSIFRKDAHDFYKNIRTKANKHAEKHLVPGANAWEAMNDFVFLAEGFGQEWPKKEILTGEMETLGEYISGGINDIYDGFFTGYGVTPLKQIKKLADKTPIKIEALIESVTQAKTQTGKNKGSSYAKITIVDTNKDHMQMMVWSNVWKKIKGMSLEGKPVRALCRVNNHNGFVGIALESIEKIME